MVSKNKQKLIVIVGPTASGKTGWSLRLAKKINGEIISADSRQVYKKMNIGTAKGNGEWRRVGLRKTFFVEDIPHHLIDFLDPGKQFKAPNFRDKAFKYIKLSYKNKRYPIVVGGTGLYISTLIENFRVPMVLANNKLRNSLMEKSVDQLHELLLSIDKVSADKIDKNNKRRVIRALEVSILSGEPFSKQKIKGEQLFDCLKIGIDIDKQELYEKIDNRVDKMIEGGLEAEVKCLLDKKYNWNLPSMSGIGYKQFKEYFEGIITIEQVVEKLKKETKQYAKRQLTWFRKDRDINWCKNYEEAESLVQKFLK